MKQESHKAQFSMEHLMTVAIAMITLLPIIYLFYSYSQESTEDIKSSKLDSLARTIINNAESVYYLGSPSKVTLQDNMPPGVTNVSIIQDNVNAHYELVFRYGNNLTQVYSTNIPINASFSDASYSQGTKSIAIQSFGSYVNISIT